MDKKPRLRYHKGRYKEMTIHLAAQKCLNIWIRHASVYTNVQTKWQKEEAMDELGSLSSAQEEVQSLETI